MKRDGRKPRTSAEVAQTRPLLEENDVVALHMTRVNDDSGGDDASNSEGTCSSVAIAMPKGREFRTVADFRAVNQLIE